ncbi:MAG: transposase [Candidatus Helarchaeota archaeon]
MEFLKKKGRLKEKVRIAFDYHEDPFYGDPDLEFIHKDNRKLGTNYFFKYITCNICVVGYRVELGVKLLKKKEKSVYWVRGWLEWLIAAGIKIEWVLLDRGFYSISTCKMIDQLGLKFIIPAKKFEPIKKLALQYYDKRIPSHYNYIIENSDDKFEGTLIFATEKGNLNKFRRDCQKVALSNQQVIKKIWVYFTNWHLPKDVRARLQAIREIPGMYKSRWEIETSYRIIDEFHVPTCSKTPSVRYFFFMFQALMYNCWVLTNLVLTFNLNLKRSQITVRYATFKFEIGLILTQTSNHSNKPPPKTKKSSKFARIRKFFRRNQN